MKIDVIFSVRSSTNADIQLGKTIREAGGLTGINSGPRCIRRKHLGGIDLVGGVDFIDFPFIEWKVEGKNFVELWDRHLGLVAKYRPKYAVAPDVFDERQLELTYEQYEWLKRYAAEVIIPIKAPVIADLPEGAIVGIPSNFNYAEYRIPDGKDLAGRRIHILGSAPLRQLEMWTQIHRYLDNAHLPLPVLTSVDGNVGAKAAHHFAVYNSDGTTRRADGTDYYERVAESIRNIMDFWRNVEIYPYEFL